MEEVLELSLRPCIICSDLLMLAGSSRAAHSAPNLSQARYISQAYRPGAFAQPRPSSTTLQRTMPKSPQLPLNGLFPIEKPSGMTSWVTMTSMY